MLGVIEFFSRQVREPDADLLEMMDTIAGQIGQFMERTGSGGAAAAQRARACRFLRERHHRAALGGAGRDHPAGKPGGTRHARLFAERNTSATTSPSSMPTRM